MGKRKCTEDACSQVICACDKSSEALDEVLHLHHSEEALNIALHRAARMWSWGLPLMVNFRQRKS